MSYIYIYIYLYIVRTNFGFDPKQDWILAQQDQTINL